MSRPFFSVCIPAYNRASHLPALLDSILAQDFDGWECVIAEDDSRERAQIRAVAEGYVARAPGRIRYTENSHTLGYDGNFRQLVSLATGEYIFMMGNDDVVAPGAFRAAADALAAHPGAGALLRAYACFRGTPDNIVQVNRYYAGPCTFPAGASAVLAFYRRYVVFSGIVLHRDSCAALATDRWDGTLFYQHWLVANILCQRDGLYIPDLLALFRKDGVPEFGNAQSEREHFTPGIQPPETDVKIVRALFAIAEATEVAQGVRVADDIRRDFANFGYPLFAHQAHEPWRVQWQYYRDLGALGLSRYPAFHFWFWTVSLLGVGPVERVIQTVRRAVGHTPNLTRRARPTTRS